MEQRARGTFEVSLKPLAQDGGAAEAGLGRLSIDKQFRGDIEGASQGQMLSAAGAAEGSAGYVAMERVTGTLHGRSGSFVLQHSGSMHRGAGQLSISVVPDSGTGALAGLAGSMTLSIAGGVHSYELVYTLPE